MIRRLALLFLVSLAQRAAAITIQLDYTYDTFFATHPTAKATLEAAAADLGAAILPTLGAVPQDTFTGTNGGASATVDWSLNFTNPSTGASVTLDAFNFPADRFTIYVGMRSLTGSTLGQGGPGAVSIGLSGGGSAAQWNGAVANMQTASNAVMLRGGGPVMGTLSGSFPNGAAAGNYSLQYGAFVGSLWFDNDSNNNGVADDDAALNNYWHFDLAAQVSGTKNDFYSVALHEMMHSLGFGNAQTWTSLRSGTTWLGAQAVQLYGSGTGLISSDGAHIAADTMSPRLSDGVMQEVAMDPSITAGTRKELTQLDLAFLRDLGYATIPEPGSAALLAPGALLLARRRRVTLR